MANVSSLDTDLLTIKQVCTILGVTPPTVYRGIRAGRYPAPIKLSPQVSRWRRSELAAAIERAAQARGAPLVSHP